VTATTAHGTPVFSTVGASFGYGRVPAVREVSISVQAGEVVALLGANGAGKTTTLLGLEGALRPMAGHVELAGKPCSLPPHRRVRQGLAIVPAERKLIFRLTVQENLRLANVETKAATEYFPELAPLLGRRTGLLSGGEQQMVALARALAMNPRGLLIDEISLGLAPLIVMRLFAAVRKAADNGVAVLLVEQYARQALAIADRGHVLARGRTVTEGPASKLLQRIDEIEHLYMDLDIDGHAGAAGDGDA
jgi:branched-chain amino acid transport system ATP-binding protein